VGVPVTARLKELTVGFDGLFENVTLIAIREPALKNLVEIRLAGTLIEDTYGVSWSQFNVKLEVVWLSAKSVTVNMMVADP
jgi:hypothetical protein